MGRKSDSDASEVVKLMMLKSERLFLADRSVMILSVLRLSVPTADSSTEGDTESSCASRNGCYGDYCNSELIQVNQNQPGKKKVSSYKPEILNILV